ncbi:ATP synthase subunit C lysine N-methyltransferase-like [Oppia nitens]|uniref:ATP synthase subunit C lysine N-methyltransferase-like n=1 Tax=Oppia nitens TaxID=1686743 RepID=UPI0023DAA498|nr:ATP synthase subunit C lysine N-methyltransferase-like [Oppia nitens]
MTNTTLDVHFKPDNSQLKTKRSQLIASIGIAVFGGVSVSLLAISLPFVWPAFRRQVLPYIPATDTQVRNVLSLLRRSETKSVIDLGSGDGRIVIECARLGLQSHGVELNPWLVLYSKFRSRLLGTNRLTHFQRKDLWKINTSNYDNIVIFGVEDMMSLLETKIIKDCKQSGNSVKVIACRFPLPNLIPIEIIGTGIDTVWLYRYPNHNRLYDSMT